ncbi:alkaline phosphatase family protein [Algoriphagus machipongonensis]|uniref:Type I phosphodiesterase / nucleotide pyrophosphatase family protein n=1 Tax=Algoriphagus machipongonensis TaxID=388413 RepID=A3HUN5_9BACT|nr:alkaline phosphatase family protein [Algoriphagus machipongonensis]EAZ81857.1 putative type I phosphodiesterase / nucleotide pyrophosphatase family protein [Algoriphagus machipongonensis]
MKKLILASCIGLFVLQACSTQENQEEPKAKKALFVIVDGIPDDVIDSVATPNLDKIIAEGGITKATMGGEKDGYSQTPTISAVGYNSVLTGVWANKHNVWGNSIKDPNYHYPTIFRAFKDQFPEKSIGIFSTWLDNRTKLAGASLPQTQGLTFDYHFDGLELDTVNYPHDEGRIFIYNIDEEVSKAAAKTISENAPDLSWMYLEFTDDMSHRHGNSPEFVDAVEKADIQIGRVWDAIKEREANFNEDWLIVITTDHGRDMKGYGHGGQSDRERSIWIATNSDNLNNHFQERGQTVDIFPSIANFLGMEIPKGNAMELDGVPFIGPVDASQFKAEKVEGNINLNWKTLSSEEAGKIWISTTNDIKTGGEDNYELVAEVNLQDGKYSFTPESIDSEFYKIVLETPSGYLNYWIIEEKGE